MASMKPIEFGMLILLSIFWGGSFFFVEVALRGFDPFTLVFLRVAIAALILFGVAYMKGLPIPASLNVWAAFFVMGAINNAIPFCLIAWGQTRINGGTASIFNAMTPIFTVIVAHLFTTDERLTFQKLIGVLIGFSGVYVMMKPELKDGFSMRGMGQMAVVGAAICYGFAGVYGKRFKKLSPMMISAGTLACSAVMLLPVVLVNGALWSMAPPMDAVAAVLGSAAISTAAAYLLFFRILATAGATNVMLVTFLIPISALMLGVGVLGEVIQELETVGMGCIFLGLVVIDGRILKWVLQRKAYTG